MPKRRPTHRRRTSALEVGADRHIYPWRSPLWQTPSLFSLAYRPPEAAEPPLPGGRGCASDQRKSWEDQDPSSATVALQGRTGILVRQGRRAYQVRFRSSDTRNRRSGRLSLQQDSWSPWATNGRRHPGSHPRPGYFSPPLPRFCLSGSHFQTGRLFEGSQRLGAETKHIHRAILPHSRTVVAPIHWRQEDSLATTCSYPFRLHF